MAIADITKPMALDETLQSTNTALGLLAKDTTISAISTALGLLGKDTSIQAITTALGLLNKDATMVTQNSKLDTIIAKLQGIIEALGVDTSIYKAAGNKACADLTSSLLVAGNLGNVYNITDNGTTTADFVEGAGKPIHLGDNVAVVDIGTGGNHVYKFDLLSGLVDLSNYIQKSETAGLIKNDGTIDETPYTVVEESDVNGNIIIDDVETPVYRNYGNNTILQTDKTPFLTRQTLNPTGFSGYVREKLIGASYAWNQLVNDPSLTDTSKISTRYCTFTVSNGVATFTPSSEGTERGGKFAVDKLVSDRKYLVGAWVKCSKSATLTIGFNGVSVSANRRSVIANTWTYISVIYVPTLDTTDTMTIYIYDSSTTTDTLQVTKPLATDITLAFGSTIADYLYGLSDNGGITKLRGMGCPINKYTPYGYGLYSVKTSGKKIVGFNIWDEEWELGAINLSGQNTDSSSKIRSKNYISVFPNIGIYINKPTITGDFDIFLYDSNKNYLGRLNAVNISSFNNDANCYYIRFSMTGTSYGNNISFSFSSGTYEPYSSTTYSLGNDELRGKFDLVNGEIVASGDVKKSNGEIDRVYGIVDLGTLTWTYDNTKFSANITDLKYDGNRNHAIMPKYSFANESPNTMADKCYTCSNNSNVFYIKDSAYSDYATFKNAMSGIYCIYELATPTTETSTPFADPMSLNGATTEEYIDTRDIPCPVGAERQYMGQSEDVIEIPSGSLSDGKRKFIAETSGGKTQYYWETEADESGGSGVTLPQCICKRTGYSANTVFSESMQFLNISTGNAAFSIEAYFYLYDASDGYILTFGSGDSHRLFGMGASNIVTYGDDWSLSGTHTGLHHRVITYDGNVTIRTYQDGELIDTHRISSALNIANSNIYWGSWITASYGVRGNVHYAKYYNKVLTESEAWMLYVNRNSQF